MDTYDVTIVGAGPAGLFSAYEIASRSDLKVLIIDEGPDITQRNCPMLTGHPCMNCKPCTILSGVGGAGGLSDGTMNLHPQIGGDLIELLKDIKSAWDLIRYVDYIFVKHDAPNKIYKLSKELEEYWVRKAASAGIKFVPIVQRHIGSDNTKIVIKKLKETLERLGVRFLLNTKVKHIKKYGIITEDGKEVSSRYLIIAPGRSGAKWFDEEAKRLGINVRHGPIDVGVRVEVPAIIMDPITSVNHDPKFHIYTKTYDDFVRTFCTNDRGFVVPEYYNGFVGVNGHSMHNRKSENTNFALLVRIEFTEPVENTTQYGIAIARMATLLGGGKPLIQRFSDLIAGRRSTWQRIKRSIVTPTLQDVTPGDIAMALPHRIVTDIIEGLERLDKILPGVSSDSTLLYAPEIKFYAMKVQTNDILETNIENIFVAGDGAGITRGLVTAAATGVIAGRGVLVKEGIMDMSEVKRFEIGNDYEDPLLSKE
ncbi:MAG: FAD-dependent oxidoreductase [Thermoplasmata archaeon]|nr:MAG: FAD-dependent oxidoreductase [Thermoplasmata archaeon]